MPALATIRPPLRAEIPLLPFPTDQLWVESWTDEVTDALGHDPRSAYVERFWLGTLGPSATWLARAFAYGLESSPNGFELSLPDMAKVLGIGDRVGRHSPMQRALARLCQFEVVHRRGDVLVARRRIPWLEPRQVNRLSAPMQQEHRRWEDAEAGKSAADAMRRRAGSLAMSTIRSGGTVDDAERALVRWKVHPSLTRTMAEWAAHQLSLATPES